MRDLLPLILIEALVWLMLIFVGFVISRAVLLVDFKGGLAARILSEVVQVVISGGIALICLIVWKRVTEAYFWHRLKERGSIADDPS